MTVGRRIGGETDGRHVEQKDVDLWRSCDYGFIEIGACVLFLSLQRTNMFASRHEIRANHLVVPVPEQGTQTNLGRGEDTIAWASENSGIYMVKLAYRSLMTHNEPSSP